MTSEVGVSIADSPKSQSKFAPYTVREVAGLLGVSEDHVRVHHQTLGGYKIGARYLFPRHRIDLLAEVPSDGPTLFDTVAPPSSYDAQPRDALLLLLADAVRHVLVMAEVAHPGDRNRSIWLGDLAVLVAKVAQAQQQEGMSQ